MAYVTDQRLWILQDQGGDWVTDQGGDPLALTGATVEAELQRRLRIGSSGIALSDANLYSVMNLVQRTVNYAFERKVSTATLSPSSSSTLYYCTTSIAADCYKVLSIYETTRTIMKLDSWNQLHHYDRDWYNSTGTRQEAWAHIGHNMLAVYPAGSTAGLGVTYLAETTTVDSSGDTFNLPDIDADLIYDLCEVVLLAHLKLYPEIERKVGKLKKDIAPYVGGE